jgi:hypothetical protein
MRGDTMSAMPSERQAKSPTRITFTDNMIKLIIAIFVVPAPFEIIVGVVKREQYDYTRLAIILGALVVLAVLLAILRNRQLRVQSIVGYYLVLAGSIIAAFGLAVTFRPDLFVGATPWTPYVTTGISALAPSLGLLLVASGFYLVREQRHRIHEDLDQPGPTNIMSPRMIKLNGQDVSIWRSDHFTTRPGAKAILELCQGYLSVVDLHFVAYYGAEGDCLFYLDCLDDEAMAHFDVRDTPDRRRLYERHGRHLRSLSSKLDKRFLSLDSGVLVRLVFDVKKGALYLYNLEREGFLLGVTLDQRQVDQTDQKLSELANRVLVMRGGVESQDFSVRLPPEQRRPAEPR